MVYELLPSQTVWEKYLFIASSSLLQNIQQMNIIRFMKEQIRYKKPDTSSDLKLGLTILGTFSGIWMGATIGIPVLINNAPQIINFAENFADRGTVKILENVVPLQGGILPEGIILALHDNTQASQPKRKDPRNRNPQPDSAVKRGGGHRMTWNNG